MLLGQTARQFVIDDPGPGTVTGVSSVKAYYRKKAIPYSQSTGVNTANLPEGKGWLKVVATDGAGNSRSWAKVIKIDRTAPKIKGKRVKHLIGGFQYFEFNDKLSGARFKKKRIYATKPGRQVHYLGNRERMRGVVEKCTFCIQRTREGRLPACAEACPTGARVFGNLLDPDTEIRWVLENKQVFRLKEDLGTEPRFWYFMD